MKTCGWTIASAFAKATAGKSAPNFKYAARLRGEKEKLFPKSCFRSLEPATKGLSPPPFLRTRHEGSVPSAIPRFADASRQETAYFS